MKKNRLFFILHTYKLSNRSNWVPGRVRVRWYRYFRKSSKYYTRTLCWTVEIEKTSKQFWELHTQQHIFPLWTFVWKFSSSWDSYHENLFFFLSLLLSKWIVILSSTWLNLLSKQKGKFDKALSKLYLKYLTNKNYYFLNLWTFLKTFKYIHM